MDDGSPSETGASNLTLNTSFPRTCSSMSLLPKRHFTSLAEVPGGTWTSMKISSMVWYQDPHGVLQGTTPLLSSKWTDMLLLQPLMVILVFEEAHPEKGGITTNINFLFSVCFRLSVLVLPAAPPGVQKRKLQEVFFFKMILDALKTQHQWTPLVWLEWRSLFFFMYLNDAVIDP